MLHITLDFQGMALLFHVLESTSSVCILESQRREICCWGFIKTQKSSCKAVPEGAY